MAAKPSSKAKSPGRKTAAAPKTPPKSHAVGKKRQGKAAAAAHLRQTVVRNIAGRKRAEDALQESEERFRELFDNTNSGIAVYEAIENGADFVFKDFNRAAQRIDQTSQQAVLGRRVTEVFPGVREMGLLEVFQRVWRTGQAEHHPMTLYRDERITGWRENYVYRLPSGEVVAVYDDVTPRRQAEEATRKAQAELLEERQHEKEHAEAELARMRDRLVRATRLAAIGQVSASIAHDLRNPLGTVRNAAYYLGRRLPKDQPEITEYLGIINQEVAAADRIITNLLAVAGAKEPVKQDVDVGQAIREALAQTGQSKAVRLRMSLAPEPFMVRADPDHLRLVFRNLVNNTVEAMGDGGEIIVEAARDADGDSIVLRDTGPGVAQEIRETVFEPLVTTRAKGIGLGLTICRQIIEHHDGSLELIDKDKPGAAFRIRLPRP